MRVFSGSTRTAIFRNDRRIVSKVAVRQRERFGAAPRSLTDRVELGYRETWWAGT